MQSRNKRCLKASQLFGLCTVAASSALFLVGAFAKAQDPVALIYEERLKHLDQDHLKVLSLNTWFLDVPAVPFGDAKDMSERLAIMPDLINDSGADIVAFQEVWREHFRNPLAREMARRGYQCAYSDPGMLGNGLFVCSKFKILSAKPTPGGEPAVLVTNTPRLQFTEYTRSDENPLVVRKGAMLVQIEHPNLGIIDLFNIHTGAVSFDQSTRNKDSNQEQINLAQLEDAAEYIRKNHNPAHRLVVMTDMNSHYQKILNGKLLPEYTKQYQLFTESAPCKLLVTRPMGLGLKDSYGEVHGRPFPARDHDYTYDTKFNAYASSGFFSQDPREVLDYIFYKGDGSLVPSDSKVVFDDPKQIAAYSQKILGIQKPWALSDHFGILTTFDIHPKAQHVAQKLCASEPEMFPTATISPQTVKVGR